MQTKFHVPRSHSFREKCDDNLKLASHFSPILCDRGTWNFFCIIWILYANQISCSSVTQFSRKIALINNFEILQVSIAFFSDTVRPRNLKFFLYINPYGYSMQTKFHVPRSHSFREKCDDLTKLHIRPNKQLWNFQVSIAFFSDTVRPRNLKFFLYINPYGYSMQTKFHVPRSHSFREKCDDNLQKFKVAHSP